MSSLLAFTSDAKTKKGVAHGVLTGILYLIPDNTLCPMAQTAKCADGCLVSAGRGAFTSVQKGRARKTALYYQDPVTFVDMLAMDIRKGQRKAAREGLTLAIRLNGTSDIAWEHKRGTNGLTLFEMFPDVQFYDYTKLPGRKTPANYHLTVSYSGANPAYAAKAMASRHNVAVVFRTKELPAVFQGRRVINGDITDLRFKDETGVVVGLYAKGRAKKDTSGFVVDNFIIARVA